MPLCFIEPQEAIRVVAESVGREARRQLLGELVRAWVDEIPEAELPSHYAKAVADLDEHDLSMLAAWHASMEVGMPLPSREFLVGAYSSLESDARREALKIAAGFRGEEAFEAGAGEAICGSSMDLGALTLDLAFFRWHSEGQEGVGRYDILKKRSD